MKRDRREECTGDAVTNDETVSPGIWKIKKEKKKPPHISNAESFIFIHCIVIVLLYKKKE